MMSPNPVCSRISYAMRRAFYGTAGRAFLTRLVETRAADPDGFYELVKGLRQQFISDHLPAGSDGQVRSVAGRFGVVAAAGELATEWGILPWEIGEATQAAAVCFQAWLNERGGIGAGEVHAAIRQVRAFFEQHGGVTLSPKLSAGRTSDHQSLWLADAMAGAGSFSSCREAWKSEVCRGIDGEMAAKALADRELAEARREKPDLQGDDPGNGRPRVYVAVARCWTAMTTDPAGQVGRARPAARPATTGLFHQARLPDLPDLFCGRGALDAAAALPNLLPSQEEEVSLSHNRSGRSGSLRMAGF